MMTILSFHNFRFTLRVLCSLVLFTSSSELLAQTQDPNQILNYMSFISSKIAQRPLTQAESNQIRTSGASAIPAIVQSWTTEEKFSLSAQAFVDNLLMVSGSLDGIDYGLPGYLGRDIARRNRPYSELLTASSCVNASGQNIACDTGAPYTAGVLTTRAFLRKNAGAYNISRAGKMTAKFLCTQYPFSPTEEPPAAQASLVDEFATTSGAVTFGNGNNCYSCHSQFAHHTQFMIKFDALGIYRANATGLQAPGATAGASVNGLMTSHFREPARAASESGQMLGRPAANLAAAARVITEHPKFLSCAVQNLFRHYLRLSDQNLASIRPELYSEIASQARTLRTDPGFSELLIAIVSHPKVIESFINSGARP